MPVQFKERAISVVVNNRPDVLARIAGTFSARGFNIESISANITRNPAVTKIIITTLTTPETITKVIKQLNRLGPAESPRLQHIDQEFTGDREDLEEILTRLESLGMEDFSRTGVIALERSKS